MKLEIKNSPIKFPADSVIAGILDQNEILFKGLPGKALDLAHKYQKDIMHNKTKTPLLIPLMDHKQDSFLFFAALESVKYYSRNEAVKILAYKALQKMRDLGRKNLIFLVDTKKAADIAPLLAEGLLLGAYRFDRYLSKKDQTPTDECVTFVCNPSDKPGILNQLKTVIPICESVNSAREIIDEPSDVVTPEALAKRARSIARRYNLRCRILDEKQLAKQGYNGLLTVGAGSPHPPRLIVLEYIPRKSSANKHLCIVGKGITFDTGGICLKPAKKMWEMKTDMSGAAAALHAIEAAARLSIPLRISSVIPAAENAIGRQANLPGYIFRAKNGKTVHVINTDAEGRLILTDAFAAARDLKPSHLVDLATLTGSCISALGYFLSGLFGNDPAFNKLYLELAEKAGEPCWELPLHNEYMQYLSCDFADINNIGAISEGGAIQAALFLSEFIPEGVPWIHLDIAGPARIGKDIAGDQWKYLRAGASGVGIRALILLARRLAGD
ncbi:leucyl aminopeptidase family protein [Candidatus Sumerlaeota bacterium]|nr:leucyl aminopeptidase family protein [Candidatus Sumerlaeota bacterium]